MTFEHAYQLLLKNLDMAYANIRKLHGQQDYLNPDAPEYQAALGRFKETEDDIFTLKSVWNQVLDLEMDEGE